MPLGLSIIRRLGFVRIGGASPVGPVAPAGFVLLLGADGAQLIGADGAPLYGVA